MNRSHKTYSPEQIKLRTDRLAAARAKRWAKPAAPDKTPEQDRASKLADWAKKHQVAVGQPEAMKIEPDPPANPDLLLSAPQPEPPQDKPEVAHTGQVRIGRWLVSDQCANNILKHMWAYVPGLPGPATL